MSKEVIELDFSQNNKKFNLSDIKNISNNNEKDDFVMPDTPFNLPTQDAITEFYPKFEPVLSPEECKEKRMLIIHIRNYIKSFPEFLEEFKNIDFTSKNISELKNIIEEIKLTVCNSNNGELFLGIFHGGCDLLESCAPIINYDLTGLKYIATKNENIIKCIKEISLEYQQLNYIRPEKRLMLLMFTLCYGVNNHNKATKYLNNHLDNDIDNKICDKYNDI